MEEQKRLKIGFISNNPIHKTGLGRNIKALLPILYKKNKWDIHMLNQQMPDNAPEFLKLPWKNEGCMKNFDQNRFNQDPGYQRYVAYANCAVEDWVTRNRLDVVFALDDPWSFSPEAYFKCDWFRHMKQNFFPIITIDSEPVLPLIKEWAQNCPNMLFWASFGERILKEEDSKLYAHCKTQFPAFNVEHFKPLLEHERQSLRQKFNISPDEKIIIYVFRNQLRKLAYAHMEALAKFKKRHPEQKIRLLFHTSWSEPAGWPLNQIREELKLNKEDILTTYYCKNCSDWHVQPFEGEDLQCNSCGQKQKITAGVTSTINEEELNKIYNLADGACSCATSGGSELFSQESMLAGVPFSSFPYSCGEDYVKNDFVHSLKGTFTREVGTSFRKFVPDINSLVDFYEFVWNLTPQKKSKITSKARQWTIDNFEANNVAVQYEKMIDSCQPIDWDIYFNKKKELKDPNAPIEDVQDDYEFIFQSYEKILKMMDMRDKTKPEIIHWHTFLNQKGDKRQLKEQLVLQFRNVAAQKNQEANPITIDKLLNPNDKKRVGIVIPESIGDVIMVTSLLKSLRERYPRPEWTLYFITNPQYFEILDLNEYIDKLIPYNQSFDNLLLMEGQGTHKGYFDILYPVHFSSQRLLSAIHGGIDKHHLDFSYNNI